MPADPDLIPEARVVLNYLRHAQGRHVVSGTYDPEGNGAEIVAAGAPMPAIGGYDLSGWNTPAWGPGYMTSALKTIGQAIAFAHAGGIVQFLCHWISPNNPMGSNKVDGVNNRTASPPFNLTAAITPGTEENQQLVRDLDGHAALLKQLADLKIPVLWRPFHETELCLSWWRGIWPDDPADPNSAAYHPESVPALYAYCQDHFRAAGLHNLIYVWGSGNRCWPALPPDTDVIVSRYQNIPTRKRYYPKGRVDILGIDVYPNAPFSNGPPDRDAYPSALTILQAIDPDIGCYALCESKFMVRASLLAPNPGGVPWAYNMGWYGPGAWMTPDQVHAALVAPNVVVRDTLPPFVRSAASGGAIAAP